MSQDISKQKRRWLKRILGDGKARALWLAPALLSPILMATVPTDAIQAQDSAAARLNTESPSAATPAKPDAEYVIGWVDDAIAQAKRGDSNAAALSFARALYGRHLLGVKIDPVEARLQEANTLLMANGVTKPQVTDLVNQIVKSGTLTALPSAVQVAGNQLAAPAAIAPLASPPTQMPALTSRVRQISDSATTAGGTTAQGTGQVASGVYFADQDKTRMQAASQVELAVPTPLPNGSNGEELYRRGVELLSTGNRQAARDHFTRAWEFRAEMDPATLSQLKDKLTGMQATDISGARSANGSPAPSMSEEERAERQRWMSEVTGEIADAEANREVEPEVVAERLQTLRIRVSQANLDGNARKQLLTIVDRAVSAHSIYMTQNRSAIDQNNRNRQITEQIALDQEQRYKVDQQIASLVETYNDLMDKQSYLEAETIAKQVGVLDPNSTIANLLIANSRNARRIGEYEAIKQMKEDKFIDNMLTVDEAAVPFDDRQPMVFGDAETWQELTRSRARLVRESERGMSPAEQGIWDKLKQPVLVDFKQQPLASVAKTLSDMTGVLIHIDEDSLALEGYSSDSPVTLSLPSAISLRSALNLLLNTKNMDFQVRNEVLMITSARNTAAANRTVTYSVKDLVIPIPNFVTDYNSGMAGALRQAYETIGRGLVANTALSPSANGSLQMLAHASVDPNSQVLGQMNGLAGGNLPGQLGGGFGLGGGNGPVMGSPGMGGSPMSMGSPGAIGGGAAMADFDTLMNLIQQTIDPDSWLAAGGTSNILPYPSNLSIVVSAPQTTQEKIADLLESLRRLQDLQVTIEVKFITLNDNFFERIGVDFDLRIDDNVRRLPQDDQGPSTTVGLNGAFSPGAPVPFTADFDIGLSQDSFTSAVPAFGGFDAASGASLGFAILSDLEMFFFMNAAQGDQRTNVLQAPRVTMFDGQFASINDTIQRPFVTSLIPVVGDFAVAQQPVIVVLNEGTVLNVQATVSPDKRFVRLTLNPSFSQIDRVDTFTFEGSQTTRTGTNLLNPDGTPNGTTDDNETFTTGTTVQQPSFASTSVSTTVSVPDGGTILLGGIKRMREGRIERGVPILSKIPYVNRLFKNTAIGRETSTLMMTVTPRIIIQEEEEQKYGVFN